MVFLFISFCIFTGCGQAVKDPLVVLPESQYAQVDRLTTTVKRGSPTPVYEGEIQLAGFEEEVYWIEDDLFRNLDAGYEAKVKSLHVQAGDQVKQGDVMLSFSSEILDKRLSENEKTKRYVHLYIIPYYLLSHCFYMEEHIYSNYRGQHC
jgi:multidrug efflux pump subunit AcrA (membrane-fusion protein)